MTHDRGTHLPSAHRLAALTYPHLRIAPVSTPLVRTKLHLPTVRPNLVPRPRLTEQVNADLDRKLTLISEVTPIYWTKNGPE